MAVTNDEIIVTAYNMSGEKPTPPKKKAFSNAEEYQAALDEYSAALVDYDQRVKAAAREVKVATAPDSPISKVLADLDLAANPDSKDAKIFTATICDYSVQQPSTRLKVLLHTGTTMVNEKDPAPEGYEWVQTEMTRNPDGRAMARDVQALKGHRVTIFLKIESFQQGNITKKMRVLRHIVDGGVNEKYDFGTKRVAA